MNEMISLGFINILDSDILEHHMRELADVRHIVLGERIQWRDPNSHWSALNSPDNDAQFSWHQDELCWGNHWLGMWANVAPTMIQFSNNQTLQLMPFEFALIDNARVKHRCPLEQITPEIARQRYFARIEVDGGIG